MAQSNFEWLIVYGDHITEIVVAKNILEILNDHKLSNDTDSITKIIRLELYYK